MKLKALLLSCFLILVIASYAVGDEESMEKEIESLKKEVEQIREELNRLKVIILESPLSSDNYSSGSSIEYGDEANETSIFSDETFGSIGKEDEANRSNQPKWKKRENWRRLQRGVNKEEVIRILGEPERINVYIDGREAWRYPGLEGSVFIYEGKLTGWSEPDFN